MVAALLHLFFMAAFSWMLVEGLLLWSKVVTVNLSEDRHMKYYYLIGWGNRAGVLIEFYTLFIPVRFNVFAFLQKYMLLLTKNASVEYFLDINACLAE